MGRDVIEQCALSGRAEAVERDHYTMATTSSPGRASVAKAALNHVFARIRKLAAVQTARDCGDPELLERFVGARDEAAFTVLVERHGAMVLALCRRVLRQAHDADDACQATFLVLARKAAGLRKRKSLGSWLHGVAYRIAVNLKRAQARRWRRERRAGRPDSYESDGDVSWRELHAILDEELQRLPERYRAPLILCHLDGKTRDEAARALGASPGALHGLLERGRDLLRRRLTQRGVTLPAALLVTALSAPAAKAALAPALVITSTKAALALATGQPLAAGLIAPRVLTLAQEVMKIMLFTKVKIGTAIALCAGVLTCLVAGSLTSVSRAQEGTPAATAPPTPAAKAENDADFIRRVSNDLRGIDPSPAEVHFFVANKDADKRQKLIDLFIQERQAKQEARARKQDNIAWYQSQSSYATEVRPYVLTQSYATEVRPYVLTQSYPRAVHALEFTVARSPRFSVLQEGFYKQVLAAKDKKDVATITEDYLNRLMDYVNKHAKAEDVPDAMLQISVIYRSQAKTVEADAWREKLRKEHPKSSAAKIASVSLHADYQFSVVEMDTGPIFFAVDPERPAVVPYPEEKGKKKQ